MVSARSSFICLFALLPITWQGAACASQYFRYLDEDGKYVINNLLPPEAAAQGYEVVDGNGRVIRTVERQLTAEEQEKKQDKEKAAKAAEAESDRQLAYDRQLLQKFSFVSDIEAELERKKEGFKVRVSILQGNLKNLRIEIESEYDKAVAMERTSSKISDMTRERIEQLEKQILSAEALLMKHEQHIVDLEAEYAHAITRFQELMIMKNQQTARKTE